MHVDPLWPINGSMTLVLTKLVDVFSINAYTKPFRDLHVMTLLEGNLSWLYAFLVTIFFVYISDA